MGSERQLILDVSDGTVAALLCETGKRSLTPVASSFKELSLEENACDAVEEVLQRCGAADCRCILALPASLFHFKTLSLPFSDRRKIDEVLYHELLDLVSFADEPMLYDTAVIDSTPSSTRLLAAIAKEADLAPWLEILERHGLGIDIVTVSPWGSLMQLSDSADRVGGSFAYLDAGPRASSFFHVGNGTIDTIRVLPGVALDSGKSLAEELRWSLRALQAEGSVTGGVELKVGGSKAEELDTSLLGEVTEFSGVEIVDSAELGLSTNQALQMLPIYLVPRLWALAALRDDDARLLNLVRKKTDPPPGLALLKRFAPALIVLLAAAGLAFGYQMYEYRKMAGERARLVEEAEQIYSQTMGGSAPMTDPVAALRARIKEIDQSVVASIVEHPEISSVALLSDISQRMPASVQVSVERFSFDRRKVRIDGVTRAYNDVDLIKKSLERSPFYTAVAIDSAGNAGDGSGVKFSLTLVL